MGNKGKDKRHYRGEVYIKSPTWSVRHDNEDREELSRKGKKW